MRNDSGRYSDSGGVRLDRSARCLAWVLDRLGGVKKGSKRGQNPLIKGFFGIPPRQKENGECRPCDTGCARKGCFLTLFDPPSYPPLFLTIFDHFGGF